MKKVKLLYYIMLLVSVAWSIPRWFTQLTFVDYRIGFVIGVIYASMFVILTQSLLKVGVTLRDIVFHSIAVGTSIPELVVFVILCLSLIVVAKNKPVVRIITVLVMLVFLPINMLARFWPSERYPQGVSPDQRREAYLELVDQGALGYYASVNYDKKFWLFIITYTVTGVHLSEFTNAEWVDNNILRISDKEYKVY